MQMYDVVYVVGEVVQLFFREVTPLLQPSSVSGLDLERLWHRDGC